MRITGDGGVAGSHAFDRVNEHERDVGGFQMLASHDHRKLFGHQFGLALAANTGGVDEAIAEAVALQNFVDGIAGGAGDRRDNRPRRSRQRIQQRRLAHVGPADDRHLGFLLLRFFGLARLAFDGVFLARFLR